MSRRPALLLVVWLASVAVSCASPAGDATKSSPGPTPSVTVPSELPVVVTVSGSFRDNEIAFLDAQIAAFEAVEPGVLIELIDVQGGGVLAPESDSEVDLLLVEDSMLSSYLAAGSIQPLEPYLDKVETPLAGFLPNALEACTSNGQLAALPWAVDAGLLYTRRDLLEAYGRGAPEGYEELRALAAELQAQESLAYGFVWQGTANESLTHNTLEIIRGFGGQVPDVASAVAFASPETRQALQFMLDLVVSGVSPRDTPAFTEGRGLAAFGGGEAVFMRNWSTAAVALEAPDSAVAGRVGLGPLPSSSLFVRGWAVPASSTQPYRAVQFSVFLGGYDAQLGLARDLGQSPALSTVYTDASLVAERPHFADLGAALTRSRPRPRSSAYPEFSRVIYDNVHAMLLGEQDAGTTSARIDAALGQLEP